MEGKAVDPVEFRDTEFTTFLEETTPPITALLAPHPPEVQDETWDAIARAAGEAAGGEHSLTLSNLVLLASGRA